MPDDTTPDPITTPPATPVTNVSGGINLDAGRDVTVGGDAVGRDKIQIINYYGAPPVKPAVLPEQKRQHFEPEMLLVSAGPFLMGSQPGPGVKQAELPQHEVTLSAYSIGKYPVTNREYAEFIKQNQEQDPPKTGWSGRKPPADKLDHPVVSVSWNDAVAYCKWLKKKTDRSYRLPSEAEWEKAARGTDGRLYPWGNDWQENSCNAGGNDTMPVTAHPDGASPFGCQDMLGNVEEWTNTLWSTNDTEIYTYPYQDDDGREVPDDHQDLFRPQRVHRGGSYRDFPGNLRCSARGNSGQPIAVNGADFASCLKHSVGETICLTIER